MPKPCRLPGAEVPVRRISSFIQAFATRRFPTRKGGRRLNSRLLTFGRVVEYFTVSSNGKSLEDPARPGGLMPSLGF